MGGTAGTRGHGGNRLGFGGHSWGRMTQGGRLQSRGMFGAHHQGWGAQWGSRGGTWASPGLVPRVWGGGACHPQPQGLVLSPTSAPPSHLPKIYQALLMSATFSPDVEALKELVLHNPVSGHLGGTEAGLGELGGVGDLRGGLGHPREVWGVRSGHRWGGLWDRGTQHPQGHILGDVGGTVDAGVTQQPHSRVPPTLP